MKTLLFILCAFALAAPAADTITLLDNGHITRNGADLNSAASALLNGLVTAAEFEAALVAKLTAAAAAQCTAESELTALKRRIDAVLNGMLTEELKSGDGPRAAVLRTLIAEAQKTDKQLQLEELEAQAAEIAAKKAELLK